MSYSARSTISSKILYKVFFILLASISILPFLVLSFYSHPGTDDYVFAGFYKKLGWFGFQKLYYLHWQGAYTTNAVVGSTLSPVTHNRFDLYWIHCWVGLVSLIISTLLLVKYLTKDRVAALFIASAILIIYLYQLPSPAEALFWLNATYAYQMSISIGILLLLLVLKAFHDNTVRPTYWALSAIVTVLLIGTHPIAAMLTSFGLGVGALFNIYDKTTRLWRLGLLIVACISLAVAVMAPGNSERMASASAEAASIIKNYPLHSKTLYILTHVLGLLLYSIINWLGNGVILLLSVILIPVLSSVDKNTEAPLTKFTKSRPIFILTAGSMVVLSIFPTYLFQGGPPPLRVMNVVYMLFIFFWFFVLHAAVVWMRHQGTAPFRQPIYVTFVAAVFLIFALVTDSNFSLAYIKKGRNLNSISLAYKDWLSGEAGEFDRQQEERSRILLSSDQSAVVLDSLSALPKTISLGDLHSDSTYWENRAYAKFFSKISVKVSKASK